jgi:hypothetical protein
VCADGIRSSGHHGFASREGLCEVAKPRAGNSYALANADVVRGVIEHFVSPEPSLNYMTFFTHGNGLSFIVAGSDKEFRELMQRDDNVVSRKIKNAWPVEVSGFVRMTSGKHATYFESIAKDNVMFVGDASGGAGNIHGMIRG